MRRSLNHIYAQIIDDVNRRTLIEVGSRGRDFAQKIAEKVTKTEISKMIGEMLAEQAKEKVLLRWFLTGRDIFFMAG